MNAVAIPKILVVDDDPINREFIARIMAHAGFHAVSATDGLEAVNCITADEFDAVVSDVQMPRMGGLELLRNIRECFPWLPVILMSGNLDNGMREAAFNLGATELFTKPVNRGDLVVAVRLAMNEAEQWRSGNEVDIPVLAASSSFVSDSVFETIPTRHALP